MQLFLFWSVCAYKQVRTIMIIKKQINSIHTLSNFNFTWLACHKAALQESGHKFRSLLNKPEATVAKKSSLIEDSKANPSSSGWHQIVGLGSSPRSSQIRVLRGSRPSHDRVEMKVRLNQDQVWKLINSFWGQAFTFFICALHQQLSFPVERIASCQAVHLWKADNTSMIFFNSWLTPRLYSSGKN